MMKRQQEFELQAHRDAINKIRKEVREAKDKNYYSSTTAGRRTVRDLTIPFAEALVNATNKTPSGKATVTVIARSWQLMQQVIEELDPYVVSTIALKKILDSHGVMEKLTASKLAVAIGGCIEDEIRFKFYDETAPEEVRRAARRRVNVTASNPHYRSYSTKKLTENYLLHLGFDKTSFYPAWTSSLKGDVGLFILEVALMEGYIRKEVRRVSLSRTQGFIVLSPELEYIQLRDQAYLEELSFTALPLIEIPNDWKQEGDLARLNYSGGYFHEWIRQQLPMCRGFHYDTEFGNEAINLLNTLQHTAWNIDNDVFETANLLLDKGEDVGSLISLHRDPRLDEGMPLHIQALPDGDEGKKNWKREKKMLYENFEKKRRKSIRSRQIISLASQFISQPRFYLSWSCDFRGRMYTQQPWLNYQGTEMERSLVTFSDGCKLNERGELWAAKAIGRAYLGSSGSFDQRSEWTYENKEFIKALVDNPIGVLDEWKRAKDPWQFMQLALEWNRVVITKDKHLWDVPIGADSTSSGLQLLSAMRRDPVGMKFANLLPSDEVNSPPLDAYLEVLRVARGLATQKLETKWLAEYLTDRSLGKPVLMTMLYGGAFKTNREAIISAYRDLDLYPNTIGWEASGHVTTLLRRASKEVFPMAFDTLKWFKQLAKISKENGSTSFKWNTPNCDLIHHIIYDYESLDVETTHLGKVRIPLGESKPNPKKLNSGLAANFVHSYDAAILKSAFKDWKHPIGLIHDCLSVLPNDMDRALDRVRKGFVHVTSGDPLARLADDLGVSEEQLPRLKQGSGNLHSVLDSQYMFN